MKISKVEFKNKVPNVSSYKSSKKDVVVLFYDKAVKKHLSVSIKNADMAISLRAGEQLKTMQSLEAVTKKLINGLKNQSRMNLVFVAVGGGSIGDFVGFLASTFKRGVKLIQVPTTSLAAIDSAHGGKTALNIAGAKNQIGTFYPAETVYVVRDLLKTQPEKIQNAAMGELFKTCLLDRKLFQSVSQSKQKGFNLFWKVLPEAIQVKYKYVKKDPYETKGARKALNLGHTLGHVFEVTESLPHGMAVLLGCLLALDFSVDAGELSESQYKKSMQLYFKLGVKAPNLKRKLQKAKLKSLLLKDKKALGANSVDFVYLKSIGQPLIKKTNVDRVVKFAQSQDLV